MKIGIEVEGRHKGLSSFFIDESELSVFLQNKKMLMEKYKKTRQIYICADNVTHDLLEALVSISDLFYITLEVTNVNFEVPKEINIVLNINVPDVWKLKENDSIKFHNSDNYVLATSLESLYITKPEDFLGDEIIKL